MNNSNVIERPHESGIAIVSITGRFPGAKNVEEFWRNLRDGMESITTFTDEELLAAGISPAELRIPNYVRAKGMLDDIELFDAAFFGFNAREAEITDPQQRIFLECAWEALERAGYDPQRYKGRIGVYGGVGLNGYFLANLLTNADIISSVGTYQAFISNDKDYLSTRVSYKLNLKGPSLTVQTACSTSLVAVHLACQSLLSGECDMALAGGITITVPKKGGYLYQEGGITSPDGHCRPFDAQAKGTLGGNGVGIVLLKRLDEALADGDIIHAVIRGSAINNDGSLKVGFTAPGIDGQSEVIVEAQAMAGISADSISYVEAHGTATAMGDPIEVAALTQAFRASTSRSQFCALGSVKSNVGHLDAAAGVTGLIKTVLALKHRELPPSLHYTAPNPEIDFASSPFYVNHELRTWETEGDELRRAGVSSFGIGGTNAHVVLEEAPLPAAAAPSSRGWHLLVLSGRTMAAVTAATEKLRRHLEAHPDISLADVAYTLQVGRREFAQRRAVVCRDVTDAIEALSQPTRWIDGSVELAAGSNGHSSDDARGAVLMYSGQGAQYPGMGRELYEREAVFRETVDQCAVAFAAAQGYDLREVLYPAAGNEAEAEARLLETEVTQPSLFVLEYALTRLWQAWGLKIEALMGHSIGEYVAACISGVLSVEDGVRLVGRRGRLMQSMERGAMLAVRLSEADIPAWLRDEQISVAAVNGPQQCVLSGKESAITEAEARLTAAGVGVKRLATSHAFHSGMMREAAQVLASEINGVVRGDISIPYISNLSGKWAQLEEVRRGEYWGRQMLEPVQWWHGVEEVLASGATVLLEVGPGESLKSVVKEGVRGRDVAVLSTLRGKRGPGAAAEREMVTSLGEMWVRGVGLKWGGMYAGEARRRVELPTYEFERERYWIEARPGGGPAARIEEEGETAAERKDANPGRWLYVPVWKQSVDRRSEGDGPGKQKWLVLREQSRLSDALVERLRAAGGEVVSVSRGEEFRRVDDSSFVVHPGQKKEFERLVHELTKSGWRPQHIVHLWSVGEELPEIAVAGHEGVLQRIEQFKAAQEHGFYSLIYLAHAWGAQSSSEPIFIKVITQDTQRVTGVERLRPEQATVLGPCRVIGQEYPHLVCRNIDIQLPARSNLVKQLAKELENKSENFAVAYRGYERWVLTYERVQLQARDETQLPARLRDGGVYLITGGLGKVGLTLATQLVRSARAKLILTGRSAFPARAQWQQWIETHGEQDQISLKIRKLESLEAEGSEILVLQADVSDFARMEAAIDHAEERFGALNGVIHAAGNVGYQAFRAISETGTEEASRQFEPKAYGLIVLETLLAKRELDFCMLVSSLSSVLGGLGFAAYAAANSYMDTFVQKHNERDENGWLSVNWDGWQLDENRPAGEEEALGVTAEEGSEVFMRLLDLDRATQIVVSTGDLNARLRKWIRLQPLQTVARGTEEARMTLHARPSLSVTYLPPRTELEQRVVEIWEELLGMAPVGVHDDFFELGGHSLLATQVASRLRESLQLEIPLRDLFERATVAELAASIETAQSDRYALDVPPIVRVSRDEKLPLSFAQQRLWFLDQLEPGSALWNLPAAVRMMGDLDVDALSRAMSEIGRRHEVLRTTFSNQDGQPVQVIRPAEPLSLELVDLSGLEVAEREAAAVQWTDRMRGQKFDLAQGPLLRAKLLKLGEAEHVVVLVMHHMISDLWSVGILIREVVALYEAFRRGEPSPLPELEIQYADFAYWQRHWLQGEELERLLAYWKEQLAGAPTVLDLLPDKPRPPVQTTHGASLSFFIDEELTEGLKKVSRQHDVTLFMTLMAALNVLLYRHSGQEDILVGTTIANRNRAETEPLIGFFINSLVIRTDFSGRPSFAQLLERVRETALGAYAHQDLPFEKLVEELQPTRDMSRSPLYQVNFTMENTPRSTFELSGLTLSPFGMEINSAKHDLTLDIVEGEHGLGGLIEYNTDLFHAPTIARMIEHLQIILQSIVADPRQTVVTLPLLSEVEQHQLLFAWNDTAARYTPERTLHQLFEAQAERSGPAVAVVFEGEQLTYAELDQRANQLAHYLRAHGVASDDLVGVLMERSLEMVVALLGILKAGAAYLPLDPGYPPERLSFMLADAGLRFIISHEATEAMLPALAAQYFDSSINVLSLDAEWTTVAAQPTTRTGVHVSPDNLAYVLYTSGSTGQPKGVMITQRGLSNHMLWMQQQLPLKATDAVLQKTPFSFDASVWEFYAPLLAGARLVMAQPGGHQDVGYLVDVMEREGVTRLQGVPTLLRMLVSEGGLERCTQLREVYSGGEVLTLELAESILRTHDELKLYNLYGPTETTIEVMWQEAERDRVYAGEEVGIGRPITNTQVYVLDAAMQLAPAGVVGELYIGGAGLGRGYLKRPTLTAERFVPHPFSDEPGARLYRTGDIVRWLDGELAYLGRVDAQVKLRGFRVELSEIEVVLRAHPSIKECIVLVKADQDGGQQLVGYILSAREEREASGAELRDYLRDRLPEYMVPTVFMIMDQWPLTPSGKVDLRALPLPEVKRDKLTRGYVAPQTPVQEVVAGIWADLLKVEVVGAQDNFFELGGHSLLATQVISRIRETFKQEISLRSLFGKPTVAEWAATIELAQREGQGLEAPPIVSVPRDGKLPLSFAQQRLWFLDQLEPGSSFYNISSVIELTGVLNIDAMERALTEIVRRHEVLRTTFAQVNGEPQQIIAPAAPFRLPVIDLSHMPDEERQAEMKRLSSEEAELPFDLMRGPLLRVTLLRISAEKHIALLTMHHIISDGWSTGILIREVGALYTAYRAGRPSPFEELPIQYADFAHWERQWFQGDALERQLSYWRQQLDGAPTALALPAAKPRPAVQTFRAAYQNVELSKEVTDELKALGRQTGVTLFMSLLAAFDVLLYRYGRQTDLPIGTPIANRNRLETEALIGFFINTLVLRIDLSGDPTFVEVLQRVREVSLEAYAHQDMPFEKLVEELQPDRSQAHSPLFQVMFVLHNIQMDALELPGLSLSFSQEESKTAKFDLLLTMWETDDGMGGFFKYNTDIFDDSSIAKMVKHFQTLIENLLADPHQHLSDSSFLTENETMGLSSADFPESGLSQKDFESLILQLNSSASLK
jgi:amino acid adenylation domain-containing protein